MDPLPASAIPADAALVRVSPPRSFGGTVRLPGSKSLTNRALLLAGLASGQSRLRNVLECDDSLYLTEALRHLGVEISGRFDRAGDSLSELRVKGVGGPFPVKEGEFFLGNAGTATRFLTAALTTAGGRYRVDGDARMRERPIGDLVRALGQLGADIRAPTGCPPVEIGPGRLLGGEVHMPGSISSQFISAVLMASPLSLRPVVIRISHGELVSRPYIDLTLECMKTFGAKAFLDDRTADGQPVFRVVAGRVYKGCDFFVEGDASAASYFYAAAAVTGATVRVEGVGRESPQGDLRCADVLAAMGCRVNKESDAVTVTGGLLRGVDCNCADIPDVVPTLAAVAVLARGRTRLLGVSHLRYKESDRIVSLVSELGKLGAKVRELRDGIEIEGSLGQAHGALRGASIDTWGDHRIAMALSVASLAVPGIEVTRPQVVTKSYPGFFDDLRSLGAEVEFVPGGTAPREVLPRETGEP
jgi:3-phosphoshikimate 1-carboxyvinyltransferase